MRSFTLHIKGVASFAAAAEALKQIEMQVQSLREDPGFETSGRGELEDGLGITAAWFTDSDDDPHLTDAKIIERVVEFLNDNPMSPDGYNEWAGYAIPFIEQLLADMGLDGLSVYQETQLNGDQGELVIRDIFGNTRGLLPACDDSGVDDAEDARVLAGFFHALNQARSDPDRQKVIVATSIADLIRRVCGLPESDPEVDERIKKPCPGWVITGNGDVEPCKACGRLSEEEAYHLCRAWTRSLPHVESHKSHDGCFGCAGLDAFGCEGSQVQGRHAILKDDEAGIFESDDAAQAYALKYYHTQFDTERHWRPKS